VEGIYKIMADRVSVYANQVNTVSKKVINDFYSTEMKYESVVAI